MNTQETFFGETDVIIIGGGLSGLTAACYLTRADMQVTLFEKASHLGGRATTQQVEGFSFNQGIHAIYSGGEGSQVLKELGIQYNYGIPKKTFMRHQGSLARIPTGIDTLIWNTLLDAGDKFAMLRLMSMLSTFKPRDFAHISVQDWIHQLTQRPNLRRFLEASARIFVYSAALDLVSAEVFILKLQRSITHPILYVEDGWQTLVNGLRAQAEQAGTKIVTGARVTTIMEQNGTVQGIRLHNGRSIQAKAVVIATTPQEALKLLDRDISPSLKQAIDTMVPGQVACLDLALRKVPDLHYPVIMDLDRPLFYSIQSIYTRMAPTGAALLHAFKPLDPRSLGDPREDELDLEDLLDHMQPGWRKLVVKRIFLPRIAGVSMLPTAQMGGYAGRPDIHVEGIDNLYLSGDWIGEGFLFDASMASARRIAQELTQKNATLSRETVTTSMPR